MEKELNNNSKITTYKVEWIIGVKYRVKYKEEKKRQGKEEEK